MSDFLFLPLKGYTRPPLRWPAFTYRLALSCAFIFILFLYCGPLLRRADPVAAVVDPGVLSLLVLATLSLLLFISISLWLLGLIWPVFRDYRRYHFSSNFKSLTPWQKIAFFMVAFFLLLFAFICCLAAVF